jgi:hypothetical protein
MDITGEPDGPPVKVGVAMTDIATALYARERTGVGQRIPRPDPSGWCATLSRWDRETVCRRAASTPPAAAFARSLSGPRRQERGVGDDESQAAA